MKARLHNNGVEVRVDMGNTGENWPNCRNEQRGFPWLSFGDRAWEAAREYATSLGATEFIYSDIDERIKNLMTWNCNQAAGHSTAAGSMA